MSLELKHLAPYLPYGLRIKEGNVEFELTGSFLDEWFNWGSPMKGKPILKPMSDFDKPLPLDSRFYSRVSEVNRLLDTRYEVDRDLDFNIDSESAVYFNASNALQLYDFLFENHFDVFGLIPAGLAIDINTL